MFTANQHRSDLTKGTFEALDHGADAAVLLRDTSRKAPALIFRSSPARPCSRPATICSKESPAAPSSNRRRKWESKPGPQI